MPRGNIGRKVARAASTGGGRAAARRNTPWSWYTSMAVIVVLGVTLVGFSRHERISATNAAAHGTPPTTQDHWHEGYAFYVCGSFKPMLPEDARAGAGLHTHGDGNIHVEPEGPQDTGKNATLGRFVQLYPGMVLNASTVQYPGDKALHNGDKCGSKPGYVQVKVWDSPTAKTGHLLPGNPADLRLKNGQLITVAFVPKGTDVPKPPAQVIQNLLANVSQTASGAPTQPGSELPQTVVTVPPKGAKGTSTTPTTRGSTTSSTAAGTKAP